MRYSVNSMILACLVLSGAASQASAEELVNGGFESGALAPGWTLTQGAGSVATGNYCCQLTGAGEGDYYAVLSGGGGEVPSTIEQTFSTSPGMPYDFSFLLNGAWGGQQLTLDFADSATPNSPFQTANYTVNSGSWESQSGQFTAQGTSTIIRFTDNPPNASTDAALDAVSVTLVPEPSALGLLAFAAIAGLRRRRA